MPRSVSRARFPTTTSCPSTRARTPLPVIDSNALLPGTTFELRAAPRDGGSTVEMILDRKFRPAGWGRVGYALNRIVGRRGFAFMLRQALKNVEKQAALTPD